MTCEKKRPRLVEVFLLAYCSRSDVFHSQTEFRLTSVKGLSQDDLELVMRIRIVRYRRRRRVRLGSVSFVRRRRLTGSTFSLESSRDRLGQPRRSL